MESPRIGLAANNTITTPQPPIAAAWLYRVGDEGSLTAYAQGSRAAMQTDTTSAHTLAADGLRRIMRKAGQLALDG